MKPTVSNTLHPAFCHRHAGRTMALLAVAASSFALITDRASAQSGEAVYVDLGRWTIVERPGARYCELRLKNAGLVYSKADGRTGSLRLNGSRSGFAQGDIVFAFDDTQFGGRMAGRSVYAPSSDSSAIEQRFRQARSLTVRHGEQVIASLSLKTSSAGFRLLKQCSEQWRFPRLALAGSQSQQVAAARPAATVPPLRSQPRQQTAAQAPSQPRVQPQVQAQPQQRQTGPFPPNRALKPLNPGQWVTADDYRNFGRSRRTPGTLRFTLLVDPQGRAQECAVDQSSGVRDFDAKTCQALIKNARFEPATDANGNARQATFSSNVKFALE